VSFLVHSWVVSEFLFLLYFSRYAYSTGTATAPGWPPVVVCTLTSTTYFVSLINLALKVVGQQYYASISIIIQGVAYYYSIPTATAS
jgi:hypothetical protein